MSRHWDRHKWQWTDETTWGCEAKYIPLLNTTINEAWQYSVHSRIILECAGDVELNPVPPKTRQTIFSTGNANGGADGIQIVNNAADMDRGNVTLLDVMKEIRAVKTSVNDIKKSIDTVKRNYSELKEEIQQLKTENTNLNMKMDKLEAQSKRCNVIVSGIAETSVKENWDDFENLVRDHLVSELGMTTESVAEMEMCRAGFQKTTGNKDLVTSVLNPQNTKINIAASKKQDDWDRRAPISRKIILIVWKKYAGN